MELAEIEKQFNKPNMEEKEALQIATKLKIVSLRIERQHLIDYNFKHWTNRNKRQYEELKSAQIAKKESMHEQYIKACKSLDEQLKKRKQTIAYRDYKKQFKGEIEKVEKELEGILAKETH